MSEAPKRISDRVITLEQAGYIVPMHLNGQPWVVTGAHSAMYVPVFSTAEKLEAMTDQMRFDRNDLRTVLVTDTLEFVESILDGGMRVMVDPWVTEQGNTRWVEPMGAH